MNCINKKCLRELPEEAIFCPFCGRKQIREQQHKKRGNGQGTVYKRGDKYIAVVTVGYYLDKNGKKKRKTKAKVFDKKNDAIAGIHSITASDSKQKMDITFKELYDKWYPTHEASKSTLGNYSSAFKYFEDCWFMKMKDIDVDDLQECVDACQYGKRTKQNMRTVCGLVYKYGIPRNCIPNDRNLSEFLHVTGEDAAPRSSFTDVQLESIRRQIGKTYGADYVYCLCYLGFRPSEFLNLSKTDYDEKRQCFVGGAKTDAGKGRTVTISPKISKYIPGIIKRSTGPLVVSEDGQPITYRKQFTEDIFYPVLEAAGIDNPVITGPTGDTRHKYTPHSCRHTFSTLMKRVQGSSKDKLELIGHTSEEMLRYYQDVTIEDLRVITDAM